LLNLILNKSRKDMALDQKITKNKFYKYSNTIVKIKKIVKNMNKVYCIDLTTNQENILPYENAELILHRIYTIGEVAKIVDKRSDTIRKYEKRGLIPNGKKFSEVCESYKNWRYYERQDVYEMVTFFNGRSPGRPSNDKPVQARVIRMSQKVKLGRNQYGKVR
jgi:hypothetical protein